MTTTAFDDQFNPDPNGSIEHMDKFTETLASLSLRFTSGNSIPVERAVISRDELKELLVAIHSYDCEWGYDKQVVEAYFPEIFGE